MDYFDLHCDTAYECYSKKQEFYVNQLAVSGESGRCFKRWAQTFAVWIRDDEPEPWGLYCDIMADFRAKIETRPPNLTPVFSVEGGSLLEDDADRIYALKNDGVKFLSLTWNGENRLAGGTATEKGLTDFGKRVIDKMNSLSIACDLSHLNDKSFYEVMARARFPLATHSNCRALCNNPRNLTDNQIKLLAEKGGVIGLCFYPEFLGKDPFCGIYENIFHLCEMGFENSIAIGSDFDGGEMDKSLDRVEKVPDLYSYLKCRGLKDSLLYKIFYKNAENYIAKLG